MEFDALAYRLATSIAVTAWCSSGSAPQRAWAERAGEGSSTHPTSGSSSLRDQRRAAMMTYRRLEPPQRGITAVRNR